MSLRSFNNCLAKINVKLEFDSQMIQTRDKRLLKWGHVH